MAIIKNPLSGGGGGGSSANIVDGIIEQYKAQSGTIDANTFVEFVNKIEVVTEDETLSATGYGTCAIPLDDTRMLFAYSGSGGVVYLTVCVLNNDGTSILHGSAFATGLGPSNSPQSVDMALLDTDKVFLAVGSNVVCATIAGTQITFGTSVSAGQQVGATCTMGTTTAFIVMATANSSTSTQYSYAWCAGCAIAGTTITLGTSIQLVSSYSNQGLSAVRIDSSTAFMTYTGYVRSCTLSGTVVTVGTAVGAGGSFYTKRSGLLSGNRVLVCTLYEAFVCTVNGATTTVGVSLRFDNAATTVTTVPYLVDMTILSDKYFAVVRFDKNSALRIDVGEIVDTTVAEIYTIELTEGWNRFVTARYPIFGGMFIAAYTSSEPLELILNQPMAIAASSAIGKTNGLTKTACSTSTAGDVWVLDTT